MLDLVLAILSLFWFCNTPYFNSWSQVKIGGDQISISLTALIVLAYLAVGVFGALRWYYSNRRY